MTFLDCVSAGAEILAASGMPREDSRREASLLARNALGWTLVDWAARNRETAPPAFHDKLIALARRRATHEPIAYITGVREFFGRQFRVTPAVLIPRPETEILVEAVLAIVRADDSSGLLDPRSNVAIVDVGTGSGCIAVTLALECPSARVTASDVSPAALAVARTNADALGARGVRFAEASLVPDRLLPRPNIIVSNPPYVPLRDRPTLPPDVRDFEPASALFGGDDGLDVIRQLVPSAAAALVPGGWLVMEVGAGQSAAVSALAVQAGLTVDRVIPDLQGIPRVVIARREA